MKQRFFETKNSTNSYVQTSEPRARSGAMTSKRMSTLELIFFGPASIRAGWRLLSFIAIVVVIAQTVHLLEKAIYGVDKDTLWFINEILAFSGLLLASWIMSKIEGRTIANYGLPWRTMLGRRFWQGSAVSFASITALLLSLRFLGVFHFGNMRLHGTAILKWSFIYALVTLVIGFKEEFQYRGYGLFTLATGLGFWPAAILSSLYFAYNHYAYAGVAGVGLLNVGAFGLLSCIALQRTGSLWMSIGLHTAWNWTEGFFYGVPVTGHVLPERLLNSTFVRGSNWLTGGLIGPEGSWLSIPLLLTLWVMVMAWFPKAKYPDKGTRSVDVD